MNIEIKLDDKWVNDYEDRIAEIIQQEMEIAVRAAVRGIIKEHKSEIVAKVTMSVKSVIKGLDAAQIKAITAKLMEKDSKA